MGMLLWSKHQVPHKAAGFVEPAVGRDSAAGTTRLWYKSLDALAIKIQPTLSCWRSL